MGTTEAAHKPRSRLFLCAAAVVVTLWALPAAAKQETACAAGADGRFDTEQGWERLLGCVVPATVLGWMQPCAYKRPVLTAEHRGSWQWPLGMRSSETRQVFSGF